jgi:hypothetical protein
VELIEEGAGDVGLFRAGGGGRQDTHVVFLT